MSMLTQFLPVCIYDLSLIKLDNNHMLKSFSNVLQSSPIESAFQFKIYMPQAGLKKGSSVVAALLGR